MLAGHESEGARAPHDDLGDREPAATRRTERRGQRCGRTGGQVCSGPTGVGTQRIGELVGEHEPGGAGPGVLHGPRQVRAVAHHHHGRMVAGDDEESRLHRSERVGRTDQEEQQVDCQQRPQERPVELARQEPEADADGGGQQGESSGGEHRGERLGAGSAGCRDRREERVEDTVGRGALQLELGAHEEAVAQHRLRDSLHLVGGEERATGQPRPRLGGVQQ